MDNDGNLLDGGQHGEVVIQGDNVITGYENNPEPMQRRSRTDGSARATRGFST